MRHLGIVVAEVAQHQNPGIFDARRFSIIVDAREQRQATRNKQQNTKTNARHETNRQPQQRQQQTKRQ